MNISGILLEAFKAAGVALAEERDWLLEVVEPLVRASLELGHQPRARWAVRQGEDKQLTAVQFIAKYYAAEIEDRSLTQRQIRREDRPLYDAFHGWRQSWKRRHDRVEPDIGFAFPPARQRRDARFEQQYGPQGLTVLEGERARNRLRNRDTRAARRAPAPDA